MSTRTSSPSKPRRSPTKKTTAAVPEPTVIMSPTLKVSKRKAVASIPSDSDIELVESPKKAKMSKPGSSTYKKLPAVSILAKIDEALFARNITFGDPDGPALPSSDDEVEVIPKSVEKAVSKGKSTSARVPKLSVTGPKEDEEFVKGAKPTSARVLEPSIVSSKQDTIRPRSSGRKKMLSEKARLIEAVAPSPSRKAVAVAPAVGLDPVGDDDDRSSSWSPISRLSSPIPRGPIDPQAKRTAFVGGPLSRKAAAPVAPVDEAVVEPMPHDGDVGDCSDGDLSNNGPGGDKPSEVGDAEDDPTGVMSVEIQDEYLRAIYKGLPVLSGFRDVRAFGRYSADMEYPRVTFSALREILADSSLNSLIKGLVFDRSGFFVNMSRVPPEILRVDSRMLKMADSNDFAVGVMLGVVTECFLISEASLGQHSTVHKISIAPFAQEMRRDTSLWGQLLDFDNISGPVSEEGVSFSTRSKKVGSTGTFSSPSTLKKGKSSLFTTVKSPMVSGSREVVVGYQNARQFSETVPIYDGRPTDFCPDGFTFSDKNFSKLTKFPIFADGKRDLPANSVVAVGYTLGTYTSDGYASPNLSTNIQFVVLLGVGAAEIDL